MSEEGRAELMERFANQEQTRTGAIDEIAEVVDWQLSRPPADEHTCPDCGTCWTAPVDVCGCKLSRIRALCDAHSFGELGDDHPWAAIRTAEVRAILDAPNLT